MKCLVLFISKLADVMQVLLSEFRDLQLAALVGACAGICVDGGGGGGESKLSQVTVTTR